MLAIAPPAPPVIESVTHAAVVSFRLLQSTAPGFLLAHPTRDGGLICEHLRDGCRPGFYRVTAAGAIEPDQVLDRRTLRFTPALLPAALRSTAGPLGFDPPSGRSNHTCAESARTPQPEESRSTS
jgi:hypothetical protein